MSVAYLWRTNQERREGRRYGRVISGLQFNDSCSFLTLTTSPESKEDIERSWRLFKHRIVRRYGKFEYFKVVEKGSDNSLSHIHAICRWGYIPQAEISDLWSDIHKSQIVYIQRLYGQPGKMAAYLSKYVSKGCVGRCGYSRGWLGHGNAYQWRDLTRWARREKVERSVLIKLWVKIMKGEVKASKIDFEMFGKGYYIK